MQKPVSEALTKQVLAEMKSFSSSNNVTLLRDSDEAPKQFSWESIWLEIQEKLPVPLSFLQQVLPKAEARFMCFLVCMMLKNHCKHLSLVQRAVAILFYGNERHKQVRLGMYSSNLPNAVLLYRCLDVYSLLMVTELK